MRVTKPIVFSFGIALLAAALVVTNDEARRGGASSRLPFRLEVILTAAIPPSFPFLVADVDRDGNEDLLINDSERLFWYRLHENTITLAGERAYEYPGSTCMVVDSDGDGHLEFFVFMGAPEGWMLSCHNWFSPDESSVPAYTVGPLLGPQMEMARPWKRTKFFGNFAPVNGDHPMIFIGLNTMKTEAPSRSLLAYDCITGRRLWRFEFGPHILDLACDAFGTHVPRVVFSSISVATKVSSHGTTDSTSYVFCLDQRDGRLLWRKRMGGIRSRCNLALADLDADGRNEILVSRFLTKGDSLFKIEKAAWNVAAMNGDGEVLLSVRLPSRPTSMCAVNLDDDPFQEVLIDADGEKFFILNHDLTIRRVIAFAPRGYNPASKIYGVQDLKGDGKPEIVCWLDSAIVVRNHQGTIIAERGYRNLPEVHFVRYDGKGHIVAAKKDSLHVLALMQTPFATRLRAYSRRLTIGAAATGFIAVWAVFQVRRLLRQRRERQLTYDERQNELLTAMLAFDHGGSSLKLLDRLRLHLKNWERIRSDGVTREELFARLHQTYGDTVVSEIRHLVMLARRARVPEGSWNTLLSEAELAGEAMERIVASGSEGTAGREERIAKALAALDTVDESIAGIRSHLRSVFRTPVEEALERLIARFRNEHGASGISFALASDSAAAAAAFISPVSFNKIFEALLSNAVRAAEGKSGAELVIAMQWEGNYCRIDIRDNGCGIPRDDWERIFERHYTTKTEGGGFGLYYARGELARFGGKIHVLDSVEGSGTTMRAILRKSEGAGIA